MPFLDELPVSHCVVRYPGMSNADGSLVVVAGVIFIIGGILQTAAQNKEMMLAGRFFAGMGIGFLGVLAPCRSNLPRHRYQQARY